MDAVTIALGVAEALEHHGAHAFTRHEAVCAVVERLALAVVRQHARAAHALIGFGNQVQAHAAREAHVDFVIQQRLAGQMNRDQR